jgi:NADP-dependent 3-hydroxy acid dehydrogenase YdfG
MNTTPKVALVTGASSGFGQVTAARLSAQGFRVFGTSRAPLHKEKLPCSPSSSSCWH